MRKMNRHFARTASALIALAGVFTVAAAAQKADFTGTWKLNVAKSFLAAERPAPEYQLTKTFAMNGDQVITTNAAVNQVMVGFHLPDSKTTTTLIPDGKERESKGTPMFPGMPVPTVQVSAEWQGGTLFVSEHGTSFGGVASNQSRYFLSVDGSQLIELVEGHSVFGDTQQRLVFDKRP